MKSILILVLIALSSCNFITDEYEYLKDHAPFEVYTPEENPFRDWTEEQISSLFSGIPLFQEDKLVVVEKESTMNDVPESYDPRKFSPECTRQIRDMGDCPASWAFAGVAALGWRFCLQSKGTVQVELSLQDSISCDKRCGGCTHADSLNLIWEYYRDYGVVTEACWPFSAKSGKVEPCVHQCKKSTETWEKYLSGELISLKGEKEIKEEIFKNGPMTTTFIVYADLMNYKGGIYRHTSGKRVGNFAIAVIGWGIFGTTKYWIAQHSWGPNWGENGFFRIAEGECGFADYAVAANPKF